MAADFLDEQELIDGVKSSDGGENILDFDNDVADLDELQIVETKEDDDAVDTIVPKETVLTASDDDFNLDAFLSSDMPDLNVGVDVEAKNPVMDDFEALADNNGNFAVSDDIMNAFAIPSDDNSNIVSDTDIEMPSLSLKQENTAVETSELHQAETTEGGNLDDWMSGVAQEVPESSETIVVAPEPVEVIQNTADFAISEENSASENKGETNQAVDLSEFHFDELPQAEINAPVEEAFRDEAINEDVSTEVETIVEEALEPASVEAVDYAEDISALNDESIVYKTPVSEPDEIVDNVSASEIGSYDDNLGSVALSNPESADNPNYVKWYSGTSYDEFFEVSKQSPSTTLMGDAYRHSIHVNVGYDTYGWQASFNDGTIMNLRDVREYQLRNGKLPSEQGVIVYGANRTEFSSIDRIVIYESVEYFSYGI